MKNGLLKKATFVVVLSLVSTQVQAGWCPTWLNLDSAKDTACQVWSDTCEWTTSQGNNLRTFGDSALTSFNELDTNCKVLVGSAVVVATGGFLYGLYKVKNAVFGKSTPGNEDKK